MNTATSKHEVFKTCINDFFFSQLYQIARLGDNDDQPEFSSRVPLEEGETYFYDAHPLQNLILVDQMDNLSPIIKSNVSLFAHLNSNAFYA